jgi:16S rRNA (adenine1518-N6/adenine1519-N6)-dimethyltransferase
MNKKELLLLLDKLKIQPSKRLGQNFLTDSNLLDFIYKTGALNADDFIIEIGPGLGALTRLLLKSRADITAIEYDSRLAGYLKENLRAPNFHLIHQDACKLDFECLVPSNKDFRIIANLPYSITTPLIAKFINLPTPPKDMLLLLQKETAERLIASPDNKNYGSITVQTQNVYETEYLRTVPAEVFYPRPVVHSSIIKFTRKQNIPTIIERKRLNAAVRTAFSKRRKKMINNLQPEFSNFDLKTVFDKLKIDQNIRAENLSPEGYLKLIRALLS